MFPLPLWLSLMLSVAMFGLNLLLVWYIKISVWKLFVTSGSESAAIERLRVLNQYGRGILTMVSFGIIAFLLTPHFMRAGQWGPLASLAAVYLLIVLYLVAGESILYSITSKIRQTTDTRKERIGMTLRFSLIPLMPIVIYQAFLALAPPELREQIFSGDAMAILVPMLFVVAANLAAPLLVKGSLKATVMPPSERRDRIEEFANKAGLANVQLYQWPGQKTKMANAMVSGYGKKNIFVSDYLMEQFTEEELESVIAHEIGHIKRYHLWIRLGLLLVWFPLVQGVAYVFDQYDASPWVGIPVFLAVIGMYMGLFLRFNSRVQERQADAYVLKLGVNPLVFLSALMKLAALNHMQMQKKRLDEKLQTHPSIARRMGWIAKQGGVSEKAIQDMKGLLKM